MRLQVSEDLSLFYEVKGEGVPLVLLHGFTGTHQTWAPFEAWGDRYQLILVDIVGHGASQVSKATCTIKPFTMEAMAEALSKLLTHLQIQQAVVLGYSMGGRLALYFSVHYPERVLALILESASPGLSDQHERVARQKNDEKLAEQILSEGLTRFVDRWENLPLFVSQKQLPASVQERIRSERLSQTVEGLSGSLRGMGTGHQPSLWEALSNLRLPVILIVGEWDKKFVNLAERMDQGLPNSRLFVVQHAGHAVHVEQFNFFVKIVKDNLYPLLPN
ncbi:MAG TPA: 2-succinyl-6-hydroxy-2,4-cyclohexadiene-1-carboxylate synthase [Sporolactobacillaceae bacterium]|nr:2-succinyl-6-hydroxy-2,4-cyclohexadiene-1-carboxylate synthase [Sporolactobacillaceae bacterium]